ncbi:MAG: DUF3857 domain-containing protein [Acidobacteriota bacterium]
MPGDSSAAREFAPVTAAERALESVAGFPSAPGVVLFERGYCRFRDDSRHKTSRLEVEVRIKILDPRGVEILGEVEIEHDRSRRLSELEARAVHPDGLVDMLGPESIFEEARSQLAGRYVTKIAFPGLRVGSIIDYRYTLQWNSSWWLEPWIFGREIPTLRSEITYAVPEDLGVKPWPRVVPGVFVNGAKDRTPEGRILRFWVENLPPIPEEPLSPPAVDVSTHVVLLPTEVAATGGPLPLMGSWESSLAMLRRSHKVAQRDNRKVRRQSKKMVRELSGTRERVQALWRFVRDEVDTSGSWGVFAGEPTLDEVFENKGGPAAHKALLLHEMLEAIDVPSKLVLVANRRLGEINREMPNPFQFLHVLVLVSLEDQPLFLDPVNRFVDFGEIQAGFEGTPGLVLPNREPKFVELPRSSAEDSERFARTRWSIDTAGGVSGVGELLLTGHEAAAQRLLDLFGDSEERWSEVLSENLPRFEVFEISVSETSLKGYQVSWRVRLRDEEILGDEVRLQPSRPLGLTIQPFVLPPHERRTAVRLDFARTERLESTITWPEGWSMTAIPEDHFSASRVGRSSQSVELDRVGRQATWVRVVEIRQPEVDPGGPYAALRQLYEATVQGDAQAFVLLAQ